MELLDLLNAPPREFTPVPFWFLNGDLTHEEIRRQMKDFCDHGVYGVVLHPRMGLSKRIGYLSKAFFSYLRTAVETARELDMKIVLITVMTVLRRKGITSDTSQTMEEFMGSDKEEMAVHE